MNFEIKPYVALLIQKNDLLSKGLSFKYEDPVAYAEFMELYFSVNNYWFWHSRLDYFKVALSYINQDFDFDQFNKKLDNLIKINIEQVGLWHSEIFESPPSCKGFLNLIIRIRGIQNEIADLPLKPGESLLRLHFQNDLYPTLCKYCN